MPPKKNRAKEAKLEPDVCRELYLAYDEVSNRERMLFESVEQMRASAIIVYKKTLKNFCAKNPDIANMRLVDYLQHGKKKIKSEKEDTSRLEISEIEMLEENMMDMEIEIEKDIEEVSVKKEKISDVAVKKEKIHDLPVIKEALSDADINKDEDAEVTIKKEKISDATAIEMEVDAESVPPKKSIKKEKISNAAPVKKEKIFDAAPKRRTRQSSAKEAAATRSKETTEPMDIVLPDAIRPKRMAFRHPKPNEILVSVSGTPVIVEPARTLMRNLVISRPQFDMDSIRIQQNEKDEAEKLPEVD